MSLICRGRRVEGWGASVGQIRAFSVSGQLHVKANNRQSKWPLRDDSAVEQRVESAGHTQTHAGCLLSVMR